MLNSDLLSSQNVKLTGLLAASALSTFIAYKKLKLLDDLKVLEQERKRRLIVITGCDTGLGYSMAVWSAKLGYQVLAGCLNDQGEGAQKLRRQFPELVNVVDLDVTNANSLENFSKVCGQMLEAHDGLRLWAIIANAAVCTMGEFFWQTAWQKEQQMAVNFWGAVNFISEFRVLLLETKARVIVISSDCAEIPLPYLALYSASKTALDSWTRCFRLEVAKYGVHVVAYHPSDFATSSSLLSNVEQHYGQMSSQMNQFERNFYGDYFDSFMKAKMEVFGGIKKKPVKPLNSPRHKRSFLFLLENDLSRISVYRDKSILEKLFHLFYSYLPQYYSDKLANIVLNPDYKTIYWKSQEKKSEAKSD